MGARHLMEDVPRVGEGAVDCRPLFRPYSARSHAEPTALFHQEPEMQGTLAALRQVWKRHGVSDMFGLYATRTNGDCLSIGIGLPRPSFPSIRESEWRGRRRSWGATARHLENALNIRDALSRSGTPVADFGLERRVQLPLLHRLLVAEL